MARAKRTDRAEARRRYRQYSTSPEGSIEGDGVDEESEAPISTGRPVAGRTRPVGKARTVGPTGRPGFTDAMRASWHRPDVRGDIAALPALARTRAFYVPILMVLAGFVAILAAPSNPVAETYYRLVVLPPAMAPVFIAGFFATRASYLLGFIIATVDVLLYSLLVFGFSSSTGAGPITSQQQVDFVISAVSVGPVSGLLFAAVAAWYRRFLNMTSAGRARGGRQTTRAKPGRSGR